jgi:hypothetical protein
MSETGDPFKGLSVELTMVGRLRGPRNLDKGMLLVNGLRLTLTA